MVIQYNSRRKQFYYKYLRVKTKKGISPITKWKIARPPKWIVEDYELKKTQFTTALNQSIEAQLNRLDNKQQPKKILTEKQEKILALWKKYDNAHKVADEMNITSRMVYFHLNLIRKKGFSTAKEEEKTAKTENGVEYKEDSEPNTHI